MPNDKLISSVVITYNEETNLKSCLESVRWVDEIVIVDSLSTDHTLDIAKQYTNRIYFNKFENDFSKLRNIGLDKVNGEWVLVLDSDEYLPKNAESIIKKLIMNDITDGFLFPRRNYINKNKYLKHGYFYPDYQLRLFRNNKQIRYSGFIHEQPRLHKSKIKKIDDVEIYHNYSHTKYNSFTSFYRFFPYIRIEAAIRAKKENNIILLLIATVKDIIKHFYGSFIKQTGYKDGYSGFRAAFMHSLYLGSISFYAALLIIRKAK